MSTVTLNRFQLAQQRAFAAMEKRKCTPDPTPEEIAAACEQIQAGWTRRERRARYWSARTFDSIKEAPPACEIPCVAVRDIVAAA